MKRKEQPKEGERERKRKLEKKKREREKGELPCSAARGREGEEREPKKFLRVFIS